VISMAPTRMSPLASTATEYGSESSGPEPVPSPETRVRTPVPGLTSTTIGRAPLVRPSSVITMSPLGRNAMPLGESRSGPPVGEESVVSVLTPPGLTRSTSPPRPGPETPSLTRPSMATHAGGVVSVRANAGCASAAGPAAPRTVASTPPAPSSATTRFPRPLPITTPPFTDVSRAGPRSHLRYAATAVSVRVGAAGKSGVVGEHDLAGRAGVAVLGLTGDGDHGVIGQVDRRPQLDGARAAAQMEGADGDQPARALHPGLVVIARR